MQHSHFQQEGVALGTAGGQTKRMKSKSENISQKFEIPGIPRQALFTIKETADIFKVHVRTVERWIEEKRLGAIVLPGGRSLRITYQEILKICQYPAASEDRG